MGLATNLTEKCRVPAMGLGQYGKTVSSGSQHWDAGGVMSTSTESRTALTEAFASGPAIPVRGAAFRHGQ